LIAETPYPNVAKVGGLQIQGVKVEIVVGYIDPLTTQDLKFSGFPVGLTTWQNRRHPLNSLFGISKKLGLHYDIAYNHAPFAILCDVVYATLGFIYRGSMNIENKNLIVKPSKQ